MPTSSTSRPPTNEGRACPACGALNGPEFDRCIRCGKPFSALAESKDRIARRIDPARLPATTVFGALCILVFAGQVAAALSRGEMPGLLGLSSIEQKADAIRFGAMISSPALVLAEPFRLLSSVFVHFGLLHIGLNLLALTNLARLAEPALGTARYAIGLVLTGVIGFATTAALTALGGAPAVTAGASGAVFGVMGMILGMLVRRKDPRWKSFAVQAVFYSVIFGFAVNASNAGIMINNSAHLGGLISGFAFGWIATVTRPAKTPSSREAWLNVAAVLGLALSIGSLVLSQQSRLLH